MVISRNVYKRFRFNAFNGLERFVKYKKSSLLEQMGYHMENTRCDVNTRSGTSGSPICCSSFCSRDVQGLNGIISRVCMSLQFSRLSRLLLPTNEGIVNPHFFLLQQTFYPSRLDFKHEVPKCASICCTSAVRLAQTGRHAPRSR